MSKFILITLLVTVGWISGFCSFYFPMTKDLEKLERDNSQYVSDNSNLRMTVSQHRGTIEKLQQQMADLKHDTRSYQVLLDQIDIMDRDLRLCHKTRIELARRPVCPPTTVTDQD